METQATGTSAIHRKGYGGPYETDVSLETAHRIRSSVLKKHCKACRDDLIGNKFVLALFIWKQSIHLKFVNLHIGFREFCDVLL